MEKLNPQQIDLNLQNLPQWSRNGDALQRTFRFDDFNGSMVFVNRISALAEDIHHHPDILIRKAERLRDRIREEVTLDRARWGTYRGEASFDLRFERFKAWVKLRHAHLEGKLKALGHSVGKPLNAHFEIDRTHGPAPLALRFLDLSVGSIESVHWTFGDGGESVQRNPAHTYEKPGVYDVSLKVSGPDGEHRTLRKASVRVLASH